MLKTLVSFVPFRNMNNILLFVYDGDWPKAVDSGLINAIDSSLTMVAVEAVRLS